MPLCGDGFKVTTTLWDNPQRVAGRQPLLSVLAAVLRLPLVVT